MSFSCHAQDIVLLEDLDAVAIHQAFITQPAIDSVQRKGQAVDHSTAFVWRVATRRAEPSSC
eukprot:7734001-Heterocapsa_arctica.AAC.1